MVQESNIRVQELVGCKDATQVGQGLAVRER